MKRKVLVSTLLIVIALIFVFLTTKSILRPKKFADVYNARKELNINRLTAIAELQKLYKKENGEYAAKIEVTVCEQRLPSSSSTSSGRLKTGTIIEYLMLIEN